MVDDLVQHVQCEVDGVGLGAVRPRLARAVPPTSAGLSAASPARQVLVVLIEESGDRGGSGREVDLLRLVRVPSPNRRFGEARRAPARPRWPRRQAMVVTRRRVRGGTAAPAAVEVPSPVTALAQRPAPRHRLPEILLVSQPSEPAGQPGPDIVESCDQRAPDGIHPTIQPQARGPLAQSRESCARPRRGWLGDASAT